MCSWVELYVVRHESFSTEGGGAPARALMSKLIKGLRESATILWVRSVILDTRLNMGIYSG